MTDMGRAAEALLTTLPPHPHPKWTDWENFNKARTSDQSYRLGPFPRQVAAEKAWCGPCLPLLTA